MRRSLVGRHIAAVGPGGVIERRVPRPGLQDPSVEVVAVHLGAHQVPVDLVRNRPVVDIEGLQARAQGLELGIPRREPLGRVVGGSVEQGRRLERSPVLEQDQQLIMSGTGFGIGRSGQQQNPQQQAKSG